MEVFESYIFGDLIIWEGSYSFFMPPKLKEVYGFENIKKLEFRFI